MLQTLFAWNCVLYAQKNNNISWYFSMCKYVRYIFENIKHTKPYWYEKTYIQMDKLIVNTLLMAGFWNTFDAVLIFQ